MKPDNVLQKVLKIAAGFRTIVLLFDRVGCVIFCQPLLDKIM